MRWLLLIVGSFFLNCASFSQTDSTTSEEINAPTNHVRRATILSAAVPGAGQIYNHINKQTGRKNAFWKVPLVYAGLGATGYFMVSNHQQMQGFKKEYENRQISGVSSADYSLYDDEGLIQEFQFHRGRRDLFIFGLGAVYALQLLDATVEAHFLTFDVSENLTLSLHTQTSQGVGAGLTLQIK